MAQAVATVSVTAVDDGVTTVGGPGDDLILGHLVDGDDIDGGNGDDEIHGLGGNDDLKGGNGDDILRGGDDEDTLSGDNGQDQIYGEADNDMLYGGNGDDMLEGGAGDDMLDGGRGDDLLVGGEGDDLLYGGRGDDVLRGGAGDDQLSGGSGFDTFVLSLGEGGVDEILDFNPDEDEINIELLLGTEEVTFQDGEHGAEIITDGQVLAVLNNVAADDLNDSNVVTLNP